MRMQPEAVIVRVPNWIGDVVMATAGLSALRKAFPTAAITALAKPWVADVLRYHPDINELIIHDPRNFPGRILDFMNTVGILRKKRFDTGVLFHKNFESALLFRFAGIPVRLGRPTDQRGFLLTHPVAFDTKTLAGHQVYHYIRLAEHLSGQPISNTVPGVFFSDTETQTVREFLSRSEIRTPIIPLAAGAAYGVAKCWPSEKVIAFSRLVKERLDGVVVLLGGDGEVETNQRIISAADGNVVSVAGEISLLAQAALIQATGLCIANDSGLMHVAAALEGVRVIALFGPTKPMETAPFGKNHIVIHNPVDCWPCKHRVCPTDHRCMEPISPEIVLNAVESVLP